MRKGMIPEDILKIYFSTPLQYIKMDNVIFLNTDQLKEFISEKLKF